MRRFLTSAAAAAALSSAGAASGQPATDPFDPAQARGLADQLVLCDLSAFLSTEPDLDAHVIYVRRDDNRLDPLIPPYAGGGVTWYEDDYQRAWMRYRAAGLVSRTELAAAQRRYVRPMTRAFERSTIRQRDWLQSRGDFCEALAKNAPR